MMNGKTHDSIRRARRTMNFLLLKTGLKDLYFYFFIWMFIRKNRDGEKWNEFNLRHDWIGRIYTVRNISYENESLPADVQKSLILENIRPLVDWLVNNNLSEIIMPSVDQIEGTKSYLIKFSPLFYEISFWWVVRRALFVCLLVWLSYYI